MPRASSYANLINLTLFPCMQNIDIYIFIKRKRKRNESGRGVVLKNDKGSILILPYLNWFSIELLSLGQ